MKAARTGGGTPAGPDHNDLLRRSAMAGIQHTRICPVDGCARPSQARGWCKMHWRRWRKYGDPNVVQVRGSWAPKKTTCQAVGCEHLAHAHGYCSTHLSRFLRHGSPYVVGERLGRPLKGEVPSFAAIHKRLSRTRGPARNFTCVDCGRPAREWSYDGNDPHELVGLVGGFMCPYSLDLDHYEARCVSCHRKYDGAGDRDRTPDGRFSSVRGLRGA